MTCRTFLASALISVSVAAYGQGTDGATRVNPLLAEYNTPYGVPPFDQIRLEDYREAFLKGMEAQKQEIAAIVNQRSMPDFDNTIAALDRSGQLLMQVELVFDNQSACDTNAEMQALSQEMSPLLSAHADDIFMNPLLFDRVKQVYDRREKLGLDKEQHKLLEEVYKAFVRRGANLNDEDK